MLTGPTLFVSCNRPTTLHLCGPGTLCVDHWTRPTLCGPDQLCVDRPNSVLTGPILFGTGLPSVSVCTGLTLFGTGPLSVEQVQVTVYIWNGPRCVWNGPNCVLGTSPPCVVQTQAERAYLITYSVCYRPNTHSEWIGAPGTHCVERTRPCLGPYHTEWA